MTLTVRSKRESRRVSDSWRFMNHPSFQCILHVAYLYLHVLLTTTTCTSNTSASSNNHMPRFHGVFTSPARIIPRPFRPRMALYNSTASNNMAATNKRIFAPGGTNDSQQAQQYTKGSLDAAQLDPNPLTQFDIWFQHATAEKVHQPETVTLSTAELPSGRVSARMVYLKELDDRGWVIYSNWGTSRKAADVKSNPHASLTFWWHELERQVRVEGSVERMTSEESQVYYDTRIRGSRLGAWASQQSSVLSSREELEKQVEQVEKRFEGHDKIPVPDFWGGIRIVPDMVEFWQGRPSRLHDRFKYTRHENTESGWKLERLSP
jgi:pyridoxamine 5'-phosphate oxidase